MSRSEGYRTYEKDGYTILVGLGARDNDRLSLQVAERHDLWLHAAGYAGSHVVIRRTGMDDEVPRPVIDTAAQLAAWHSKAREAGGKVDVHLCLAGDVSKRRGAPAGEVQLRRYERLRVYSRNPFPD